MPKFKFSKACGYLLPRFAGDIAEMSGDDCQNAALMGLGQRIDAEAERTPEAPAAEPEGGGDGSPEADVPAPKPEPAAPVSLKCDRGCNGGKPFGSAVALAAHRLQKHGIK